MRPKDRVRLALEALLTDGRRDRAVIAAHFAPSYRQWVDGESLDFEGFVAHMAALDAAVASVAISFTSVLEEDDQVATRHLIESMSRDGHGARFEVIAIFRVGSGGILSCHELTRRIEGRGEDRDLGARMS